MYVLNFCLKKNILRRLSLKTFVFVKKSHLFKSSDKKIPQYYIINYFAHSKLLTF